MNIAIAIVEGMLEQAKRVLAQAKLDYGDFDSSTRYAWQEVETLLEVLSKLKGVI
jgi:HEPN domain-containing protein